MLNLGSLCFQQQQFNDKLPLQGSSTTSLQQEATQQPGGFTDFPIVCSKLSGQRAYLQSLDHSSRAWVLSSGKSQESNNNLSFLEDRESNIWYNPIPEEEDSGGLRREEKLWRKQNKKVEGGASWSSECPQEGVSHQTDDIEAEISGKYDSTCYYDTLRQFVH